jgi:hypothetical protein
MQQTGVEPMTSWLSEPFITEIDFLCSISPNFTGIQT